MAPTTEDEINQLPPRWEKTMKLQSRHSTKPNKLDEIIGNCNSGNKEVQREALKFWSSWIEEQNCEIWKQNSFCYIAVRPLVFQKFHPSLQDENLNLVKLELYWKLITKVENLMYLEGPQYILEMFLNFSILLLSTRHQVNQQLNSVVLKLLCQLFSNSLPESKEEDRFLPLKSNLFQSKKLFCRLAVKFVAVFQLWDNFFDETNLLHLWKLFLEHCETSFQLIPVVLWHDIFRLLRRICSNPYQSIKVQLSFLHKCATVLKCVMNCPKYLDVGNVDEKPNEALLKIMMERSQMLKEEADDFDLFLLSKETFYLFGNFSFSQDDDHQFYFSIINQLDDLPNKTVLWGFWCGLTQLFLDFVGGRQKNSLEIKFFRKLRGIAVNFDLDRNFLDDDSVAPVEKMMESVLEITCKCPDCPKKAEEQQLVSYKPTGNFNQNFFRKQTNWKIIVNPLLLNKVGENMKNVNYNVIGCQFNLKLMPRKVIFFDGTLFLRPQLNLIQKRNENSFEIDLFNRKQTWNDKIFIFHLSSTLIDDKLSLEEKTEIEEKSSKTSRKRKKKSVKEVSMTEKRISRRKNVSILQNGKNCLHCGGCFQKISNNTNNGKRKKRKRSQEKEESPPSKMNKRRKLNQNIVNIENVKKEDEIHSEELQKVDDDSKIEEKEEEKKMESFSDENEEKKMEEKEEKKMESISNENEERKTEEKEEEEKIEWISGENEERKTEDKVKKRRIRIIDSMKSSKKKMAEETNDEIILVENETEKLASDFSPKSLPKSRAFRMLALLPNSPAPDFNSKVVKTKVDENKKSVNFDKYSRASKMLALLPELDSDSRFQCTTKEETEKKEGISVSVCFGTPPHPKKEPGPSLLKADKLFTPPRKKCIRFDDDKNETMMYFTDSPPSQTLQSYLAKRRFQSEDKIQN